MRLLPFGDLALLAEYDSLHETAAAYRALAASTPRGVVELVPAARTVLVRVNPRELMLDAAARWISGAEVNPAVRETGRNMVRIEVSYEGPDLEDAAALLSMSTDDLIHLHTTTEWICAFIGFAPGFAYLASETNPLAVPRRSTSRTVVPSGSVGLAGEFTGVYPRASPGGWQLIGRTEAVLWDAERESPARISPGDIVRFAVAR